MFCAKRKMFYNHKIIIMISENTRMYSPGRLVHLGIIWSN